MEVSFPKIGLPPNHPYFSGVFHDKPTIWGYHHLWKLHGVHLQSPSPGGDLLALPLPPT